MTGDMIALSVKPKYLNEVSYNLSQASKQHDIFYQFTAPQRESAYQFAMTDADLSQHTP
jgi:hypothetical protein